MDSKIIKNPRVGVGVLVVKDQKILLGKRISSHGNQTYCPPGGHLEFGESPLECAKRELLEETSLIAEEVMVGPWTNDIFLDDDKHYLTVFMVVTRFLG